MIEFEELENIFFEVLEDIKDYLDNLTLVGGWLPYVYMNGLWNNMNIKIVTTTDIDFGFGNDKVESKSKTIFQKLSGLN